MSRWRGRPRSPHQYGRVSLPPIVFCTIRSITSSSEHHFVRGKDTYNRTLFQDTSKNVLRYTSVRGSIRENIVANRRCRTQPKTYMALPDQPQRNFSSVVLAPIDSAVNHECQRYSRIHAGPYVDILREVWPLHRTRTYVFNEGPHPWDPRWKIKAWWSTTCTRQGVTVCENNQPDQSEPKLNSRTKE